VGSSIRAINEDGTVLCETDGMGIPPSGATHQHHNYSGLWGDVGWYSNYNRKDGLPIMLYQRAPQLTELKVESAALFIGKYITIGILHNFPRQLYTRQLLEQAGLSPVISYLDRLWWRYLKLESAAMHLLLEIP
jgi:hypothetical protein